MDKVKNALNSGISSTRRALDRHSNAGRTLLPPTSLAARVSEVTDRQAQENNESEDLGREFRSLSLKNRVLLCVGLAGFGLFCILLAVTVFFLKPVKFAKLYTLGQVLLICSSFFVVGPARQWRMVSKSSRAIPALIYIVSLILTLAVALKLKRSGPTIIMILIQAAAFAWYVASFIPFAQRAMTKCFHFTTKVCCRS